jgi:hypothetical protein
MTAIKKPKAVVPSLKERVAVIEEALLKLMTVIDKMQTVIDKMQRMIDPIAWQQVKDDEQRKRGLQ